tara:strand:- start:625 stop:2097 length:1473 start_codon:yes stop_codon:yes gene_type:complete
MHFPTLKHPLVVTLLYCLFSSFFTSESNAGQIWIGTANVNITPDQPVAISGQFATRVATVVEAPVTATALALETRNAAQVEDQALIISCDLVGISAGIQDQLRSRLKSQLPDLDINKLFLNATHTHTAPVTTEGVYAIPTEGVIQPKEYKEFLITRLAEAAATAWKNRQEGGVSWGMGHAVIAYNRRTLYEDGNSRMYGPTNSPNFRGIEGYEDHGIEVLFFWDQQNKLIATAVNVACPAQEVEGGRAVNADFWHEVRLELRKQYGDQLQLSGWIGAAGDQSPHLRFRKAAEDRMREGRKLTRMQEIARRITLAVNEAHAVAKNDIHKDVVFKHTVQTINLPARLVTKAEYLENKAMVADLRKQEQAGQDTMRKRKWYEAVIDRYEEQKPDKTYPVELHAIRLGDIAICNNPFELFTMYGIQMKARSKALQTFVIQLACKTGGYVPTRRAAEGGGYSAIVQSNLVGPEGGQMLVEETVKAINRLWDEPTP